MKTLLNRRHFFNLCSRGALAASSVPVLFRPSFASEDSKKTGFVTHERFTEFNNYDASIESPERAKAILDRLAETGMSGKLNSIDLFQGDVLPHIRELHTDTHIGVAATDDTEGTGIRGLGEAFGADAAELAVASVLGATRAVHEGKIDNAFCLIRPPGHHVKNQGIYGFCYYANVCIAARYAQKQLGYEKVLIIDWDYHHGNGTQDLFWGDPSIFYFSTHNPFGWPGTGSEDETGGPGAEGTNLNILLDGGSGDKEMISAWESRFVPAVEAFKPDLILISAGFDARENDPLGDFSVTDSGYRRLTQMVMEMADQYCDGKVVSMLEGGYNLDGLASAVHAHIETLAGLPPSASARITPQTTLSSQILLDGDFLLTPPLSNRFQVEVTTLSGQVSSRFSLAGGAHKSLRSLSLSSGRYLVRVRLPRGGVRTLRWHKR